jgi:hypothetical protein
MKKFKYIQTLILLLIFATVWSQNTQQIITVSETTNGKLRTIKDSGAQIVDINGILEIQISRNELIDKIKTIYPSFGDQILLQNKLDILEKALEDQEEIYALLEQSIRSAAADSSLNDALFKFMEALEENAELVAQYTALYYEWDEQYGEEDEPAIRMEFYIVKGFNASLPLIQEELINYEGDRFDIGLIAFLKNKQGGDRVHIENFDTYAEREYYRVPRWVTEISKDQKEQLEKIEKKTKDLNDNAATFFGNLKAEVQKYIPDLTCVQDLKSELESFLNDPNVKSNITNALTDDSKALLLKYGQFLSLISAIKNDISKVTIFEAFEVFEQVKNIIALKDELPTLILEFKNTAAAISTIATQANTIATNFDTCYDKVEVDIKTLTDLIAMMKDQQNRYVANKSIGKEVRRFSVDNIPQTGIISLTGSGKRINGDMIDIELVLIVPSADEKNQAPPQKVLLEKRMLTLQLIGLRSETAVGIIMADSFNENNFAPVGDKRYLYAPSMALLLKVGSRSSVFYNNFIDFGFGLAISTPDFNTDGSPEFGAGLMFTAFKDILNIGINYNVTLDTPYWSFGINVPFNLPGVPINAVK